MRSLARGGDDDPMFVGLRRDRRTGEREVLTVPGVRQMVGALAVEAGIRFAVSPNVIRHSACRWMLTSGQSTIVVERILGHGSEAMIRQHYDLLGTDDAHDRLMRVLRERRRVVAGPLNDAGAVYDGSLAEGFRLTWGTIHYSPFSKETLQARSNTCGSNSMVECNLPKVEVAGSSPVSR